MHRSGLLAIAARALVLVELLQLRRPAEQSAGRPSRCARMRAHRDGAVCCRDAAGAVDEAAAAACGCSGAQAGHLEDAESAAYELLNARARAFRNIIQARGIALRGETNRR